MNAGQDSIQDERCQLKNKILDPWLRLQSLTPSYNLGLEPLSLCNRETLKQSKSSCSQMFFEISSLKNFTIIRGKHLCWGLFLMMLQVNFFKTRLSNSGVSWRYGEIFKKTFFYRKHPIWWLLLTVLPQCSKVSWGICSLILCLHVLSTLIKNLHKALHK